MDDDILQFLFYILLVIAGVAGSIIKNSKARKEQEAQRAKRIQQRQQEEQQVQPFEEKRDLGTPRYERTPPTVAANPFEEFLRRQLQEFEEQEEEVVVEKEYWAQPEEPKINKMDSVVKEGTASFGSTAESLLSDNMSDIDFSISDAVTDSDMNNGVYGYQYDEIKDDEISDKKEAITESFDAKKALIYSEILKRPDF